MQIHLIAVRLIALKAERLIEPVGRNAGRVGRQLDMMRLEALCRLNHRHHHLLSVSPSATFRADNNRLDIGNRELQRMLQAKRSARDDATAIPDHIDMHD